MKAVPTDEESAAIAVALLRSAATASPVAPERKESLWRETARREAVGETLHSNWNR